jgi:Trk K+ transport system NAD-binding subunit
VLLVAEVPVGARSPLDGSRVRAAGRTGDIRVIALTRFGEPGAIWSPSPNQRIDAGDRLAVVARRDGLSWLLAQAQEPPPEPSADGEGQDDGDAHARQVRPQR